MVTIDNIFGLHTLISFGCNNLTSSSSGRLEEGRPLVLSLFILPPLELKLLAAGVLDRGNAGPLEPIVLNEGERGAPSSKSYPQSPAQQTAILLND